MLIAADWVLPVSRRPIREGAVLVHHGHVEAVGRLDDLVGRNHDGELHEFPGCVITPGLVNAHTHLSLTAMEGLLEPAPFSEWLPRLATAMRSWSNDDYAASAELGAQRCLEAGVTLVGDIVYGPEPVAAAVDAGLGGSFFWEVLGVDSPRLYAELERMDFPVNRPGPAHERIRFGLSPHSTYTSGPRLLKAIHAAALEMRVPVAIHVAESSAEVELLGLGKGPLLDTANRLAVGFEIPRASPVSYLDHLGVLDGAIAVHVGEASPSDVLRLASTARGVVTCPRSNDFLKNQSAPVRRLLAEGIPVGVGTDSAASNHDLDLVEELRALQTAHPGLSPRVLIEMATVMGAITLGLEDRFGVLEPGLKADLSVFRLGHVSDPEGEFVAHAGKDAVEAVMSAGKWRVSHGSLIRTTKSRAATEAAAARAREALDLPSN